MTKMKIEAVIKTRQDTEYRKLSSLLFFNKYRHVFNSRQKKFF